VHIPFDVQAQRIVLNVLALGSGIQVGGCRTVVEIGDGAVGILYDIDQPVGVEPGGVLVPHGGDVVIGVGVIQGDQHGIGWVPLKHRPAVFAPVVGAIVVERVILYIPAWKLIVRVD